jgi:hypothetical protein
LLNANDAIYKLLVELITLFLDVIEALFQDFMFPKELLVFLFQDLETRLGVLQRELVLFVV